MYPVHYDIISVVSREKKAQPVNVMIGKCSHEGAMFKGGAQMAKPELAGPMTRENMRMLVEVHHEMSVK